mmetsp:Transcript_32071/g.108930  ORF Transcript_32071/g.108930 Transcript_32071/m.108930 type:complete len:99 (-) Transcript_32071:565-861(-)
MTFARGERAWTQVKSSGSSPSPRSGAASVIVGSHMYIFGGYGGGGRLDDFHCFDLDNTIWSRVEPSSGSCSSVHGTLPMLRVRCVQVSHQVCARTMAL